jgi:spoIIIJ-associated protein
VEWVETTGRSVEEAKEAALDQLGVDEHDAEFEVVEEPKTGLFGRLRSEARVRARVRPTRPRPKEDRRDRRRRRNGERPGPAEGALSAEPAGGTTVPEATPAQEQGQRGDREGGDMDHEVPLGEQATVAADFLGGLLAAFDAKGAVEVRDIDEETVELAVTGEELGLLIGPKGATLAALQEVTRTVVQRQTGGRNGRILVDVGGYREKRRMALAMFTREIAAQVRETGVRKALDPMSAADRKIVHDVVNELEGVSTTSEGEEPNRRVVIEPS